jgi:hypothetical protein
MPRVTILSLILLSMTLSSRAFSADCPNVSVHPNITAIFLQTDVGEKEAASKGYVAGFQDAIKKSRMYCLVEDPRAALFSLDLAGVDLAEDHERAAVSVVIISERNTLVSHWIRVSSIDNVQKNTEDDVIKTDRAIQRYKRHH